ncbi:hypothetical protein ABVK25_001485 [Lepraria finkii]|uniref:Uncharacterized protein n=1 Tax=Lepraria finkii TaxID=1340010 RepID=A0ABR4BJ74_9LECA
MWHPDYQQYAVAYIVLSCVGKSILDPVIGGFVEKNLFWHWAFWVQLLFGGATQLIHFVVVPEIRPTIMLDKEATRRREADPNANVWGPNENPQTSHLYERGLDFLTSTLRDVRLRAHRSLLLAP